jgi:uncharacterized protein with von Willebrand factor type A (vWA) domain
MNQISFEICTRCRFKPQTEEKDLLSELAYNEDRYISDLVKEARENPESLLRQKIIDKKIPAPDADAESDPDDTSQGQYLTDDDGEGCGTVPGAPRTQERITEEDVREALEEYEKNGEITIQQGKVIVTSKGVRKLAAGALERILKNLRNRNAGSHSNKVFEFGIEISPHTRTYEVGDDYSAVDIEGTLLNALRRRGELRFEPEDFEIREELPQSKLCAGIIIDESGSMRDSGKLEAAMETALALSRLILREPDNTLKVFVFADQVKEINPWSIVNDVISGGDTDIKTALAAFRRASRQEFGDKQVYLITDTEPNNEEGKHLPFTRAASGLIEEASRYRQENIGLNIIMLDESPELKELASTIARKNLGRVFFTVPSHLGEVLVEDYLDNRKSKISG